jgi:hypothetical protein
MVFQVVLALAVTVLAVSVRQNVEHQNLCQRERRTAGLAVLLVAPLWVALVVDLVR